MSGHSSRGLVRPFAQRLLSADLPGLSHAQRDQVAAFTVQRVDELPSVLRLGVEIIAAPMRIVVAIPGSGRAITWLIHHPLPLVGEYVRMIRSLAYTYIWEQWPLTLPDGSSPR
ncbi:unannotated protein [freshwater metagenome]|uniref:Unannotated protein n=1 Tax=freshwater metagenome TaxID=449393 RepID=A0A6J7DRI9_9ZZZZ|nr:hypothetical protein [Actinomycetota bacterium]